MSSLTSVGVNKNSKRFAVKVKARPRKSAQNQDQSQNRPSLTDATSQPESSSDASQKPHISMLPNESVASAVQGTSLPPSVSSSSSTAPAAANPPTPTPFDVTPVATPSGMVSTPTPFDVVPETIDAPSPFHVSTPYSRRPSVASTANEAPEMREASGSVATQQQQPSSPPARTERSSIQRPMARRGKKFAGPPSTRKPSQITFVDESVPSTLYQEEDQLEHTPPSSPRVKRDRAMSISTPSRKKAKGTAIAIGVPGVASSSGRRQTTKNMNDLSGEGQEDGDVSTGGRTKAQKIKKQQKERERNDPSKWKTLDDIKDDPAPAGYLNSPMSDFIQDLKTGIVSKAFKELEMEKRAAKKLREQAASMTPEERRRLEMQRKEEEERKQREAEQRRLEQERKKEEESHVLRESSHALQVRLINGQIVLDADSLVVDRGSEHQVIDTSTMEVVEETSMTRKINSYTYGKQSHSSRWNPIETELFYDALAQFGTDFTMVAHLLPGRTRNQVRNKFNKEEKKHPTRINETLLRKRKPMDMDTVRKSIGKEFEIVPDDFHDIPMGEDDQ